MKTTCKYTIMFILVSLFSLLNHFLNPTISAGGTAYIIVHVHNPEGIEIASIEGMNQYDVEIYDGDTLISYGTYDSSSHNKLISISSGSHTIKAKFNGMTKEQTISINNNETKEITFTFERTEFDLEGYLKSISDSGEVNASGTLECRGQGSFIIKHYKLSKCNVRGAATIGVEYSSDPASIKGDARSKVKISESLFEAELFAEISITKFCEDSLRGERIAMAHSFIKGSDHSDKSDFYGSNVVISSRSDFKYWFVQGNSKGDYPYLMFAVGNYEYKKRGVYVLENNNSLLGKIPASPFDGIPYTNIGWNPVKSIWIEVKGVSSSTKSASYSGEMSSLKMSSVPHDIKGTGVGSGYKSPFASFTYSPANPAVGEQVTFDASASSDSDGTVDKYKWDFGDSSTATGKTAYHSYSAAGTYTVKLTVTDNSNLTNSTQKTITITSANQSPVAAFTYSPENPKAGEKVTFDASSSSDSDGTIESYEWDFGNKSTGKGQKVYNTFTQNGDYSITLTVKDNSGATGTKTASLSVSPKGDSRGGKPKDPNSLQGDPVNIINGNMLMIKDDFSNPSPGMPFEFVRAYNSMIETDSPLGAGWTHNYNITLTPPADSASSAVIKDTDGKIIIFYQNSPGQFKPESGEYSTLSKKDSNYVWQKKDKIKYTFNSNGKLQSISDRNNNAVSITYDDNERLKTLTDTAGRNYSITCDDNNHITKVTNPAGKTVSYTYDSDGNLTKVTNTVGVVTQYEYNDTNDKHNITKQTVGNKFVYTYSYDEQDHCVSAKGPNGEIGYSFDYKFTGGNTAMPDSRGNTTTKYHNDSGKVSKIEYPDSTQEVFSWDGNLNKTSETLQDNSTWSYEYDGNGNITKAVDALGNSKIMSYDENDNLVSLIDELSRTTKYTYDGNGNLTRITLPDNTETNFTYNSRGQPLTIADSSGKRLGRKKNLLQL